MFSFLLLRLESFIILNTGSLQIHDLKFLFSPSWWLIFSLSKQGLSQSSFFLILMKFNLSMFYLMDCVFGIMSKNLSFNTKSWRFSTISSFKILYFYLTHLVCNNPFWVQFWYVNLGQGSFFGHWYPLFLTIC